LFVQKNYKRFEAIWTHDKVLLDTCPNAKKLPFGGCWIDSFDWGIPTKTKNSQLLHPQKDNIQVTFNAIKLLLALEVISMSLEVVIAHSKIRLTV